jgi:hypothetical protein
MSNPEQTVPVDVMIRRLEGANARAYERDAHAEERVSERQPPPAPGQRTSHRRPVLRGFIALLLAACVFAAAFISQSPYGKPAKQIIAEWAPQLVSTPSLWLAAAQPAPTQETPSAQDAPQNIASTAAPMSPELEQRLEAMAHDLANVAQGIEQLKTSQAQMVRHNAAVAEILKAALLQMARDHMAIAELRTTLSEIARDNASVVEQLKVTQEQTVRLIATRARPKSVTTLPHAQAQPRAAVYLPPKQQ